MIEFPSPFRGCCVPRVLPSEETPPHAIQATHQRVEQVAELLRQRLLSGLYLGSLNAGARLPSLREIADQYGVNVRLARRAYQLLEREGLVELRERSGVFFAPAVGRARAPLSPRAQWLVNVALDGLARAVPVPQLASQVARYTDASQLRAACIECNDDQTAALSIELKRAFGIRSQALDIDALLASKTVGRDLKDFDLLVTTPYHAGEVEELAARTGHAWLSMTPRANIFAEISQLLPRGRVYYGVWDPRFAAKLVKIFRNTAHGDRLVPVVVSEMPLPVDEPTAPLYVTHLARERLGGRLAPHARPSVCLFATEASRTLLAFVVAWNIAREAPSPG